MKLMAEQARAAYLALDKAVVSNDLSAAQRFRLLKALRALAPHYEDCEKVRVGLVEKYGAETEDGGHVVTEENLQAFAEEYQPVAEAEVEGAFAVSLDDIGHLRLGAEVDLPLEPIVEAG